MDTEIKLCLPSKLVDFVDGEVKAGTGASRSEVVARALKRERRRTMAARDVEILRRTGEDPELDGLAEYAARQPAFDLD